MRRSTTGLALLAVLAVASILGLHFFVYEPALQSLEDKLGQQEALLRDSRDGLDALRERFGLQEERTELLEGRIGELDGRIESLEEQIAELSGRVEALEDEVERLKPVNIQVEYSSLSQPKTFVLMLDGSIVAEVLLDPGDPVVAPAVLDLGNVMLVRWEFHTIRVTLDDEVLLGRRFFLEGEGYLWVVVGDTSATFFVRYDPPLWF